MSGERRGGREESTSHQSRGWEVLQVDPKQKGFEPAM